MSRPGLSSDTMPACRLLMERTQRTQSTVSCLRNQPVAEYVAETTVDAMSVVAAALDLISSLGLDPQEISVLYRTCETDNFYQAVFNKIRGG